MTNKAELSFRLISGNWDAEIAAARRAGIGPLRIICPFIKAPPLRRLMAGHKGAVQIITRFDLNCFNAGVSDTEALRAAIKAGGKVRGIRHLHSKLYLFGHDRVIATSANVTDAALKRNLEFGFLATDSDVVSTCNAYFADLWKRAKTNLTLTDIERWERKIKAHQRKGGGAKNDLPDYGTDVGPESPFTASSEQDRSQGEAFIKFFGTAHNRADPKISIASMIAESGCNWACTYPESKPPRQVNDGDTIYMARMVHDDMLIFGKAIGRRHRDTEDRASKAELKARDWKRGWPRYVRVHDGRFINGVLSRGISFRDMMKAMGAESFASTIRNKHRGTGNTNPLESYNRKAHMLLTEQSRAWIEDRLEAALLLYGEVDLTPKRFRPPKG